MKRILQIVDNMGQGGIQAFLMSVYEQLDTNEIQFDFLLHKKLDGYYEKRIAEKGGKLYFVSPRNKGVLKNYRALDAFFAEHPEYDIVHMHESSLAYLTPLEAAKRRAVRKRIIHSHSSRVLESKLQADLHAFNKKRIGKIATDYLACGEKAREWFYKGSSAEGKVRIITNGVNIGQFQFDEAVRQEVRAELGISDEFVLGHVGRFQRVKNHAYLVDVFHALLQKRPDSLLLLVGDGELRIGIEEKIRALGLSDRVLFAGVRNDVFKLYQAMDALALPSLYEGFPVTAIEAQAAGLPCVLSDTITREVLLKDNVKMLSIREKPELWAEAFSGPHMRLVDNSILLEKGLDIRETARKLLNVYES